MLRQRLRSLGRWVLVACLAVMGAVPAASNVVQYTYDAAGNRVAAVIGAGKSFGLSGARSFDVGGRITEFRFTMLPRP